MPRIVPVALRADPQAIYARLGPRDPTALLESSRAMPGLGGWSFIAGPAFATLTADDRGAQLRRVHDGEVLGAWADPFDALHALAERMRPEAGDADQRPEGLGFAGGLIGVLGYDLARHVERLPSIAKPDPDWPAMHLLWADHVLAFDHATSQWYFCTSPFDDASREAVWADTLARAQGDVAPAPTTFRAGPMVSRTPPAQYLAQVRQVLDLIAAGDIFQANLSHRLEAAFDGDPFALYRRLVALNPAPFSAYLQGRSAQGDAFAVAGVSPERFLSLGADGRISARPIKGTRARGATPALDTAQHDALAASVKDRAENVMIVDLMRNDLGRVARTGSVKVERLFELEAHPSVWQMVSTITARLRDASGPAELLRACWPPGSMTGAPKVRAMEIIDTLEPVRRGPYAGAVGYLDAGGAMDWSVVIRTALVHRDRVMVQVGGAVVADSDPQAELDETYAKGRLLLQALQGSNPPAMAGTTGEPSHGSASAVGG